MSNANTLIPAVNHEQLKDHFVSAALARRVLFVHGRTGIGKSESLAYYAKLLFNISPNRVFDVRPANIDPIELRGFMFPNKDTRTTEIYPPSFLPQGDEPALIIVEELTSVADPLMQSALYQLCHDYRIGDYRVPENTIIVATGNLFSDDGVVFELAGPLNNRMRHVELISNTEMYLNHMEEKLHPLLKSWIQSHKDDLDFIHNYKSGMVAFKTPRSLEDINRILCAPLNQQVMKESWGVEPVKNSYNPTGLKTNHVITSIDYVKDAIASSIGQQSSEDFTHFVENVMKVLPMYNAVFDKNVIDITSFKTFVPVDLDFGQFHAIVNMIADRLSNNLDLLKDESTIRKIALFICKNDAIECVHSEVVSTAAATINQKTKSGFSVAVNRISDKALVGEFSKFIMGSAKQIKGLNEQQDAA